MSEEAFTPEDNEPVRWNGTYTEALKRIFKDGVADPSNQDPKYVDGVWSNLPAGNILRNVDSKKFYGHYREKGTAWMSDKAINGTRRVSESSCCITILLILILTPFFAFCR